MTKAIAYCALHYGTEYLAYAIRSVIDDVSEFWVLYSATGSHGHSTDHVCPDHAADLYAIALDAAGGKLRWYTASPGQWANEGQQRDYIHVLAPDADVVLVVDADEVWADGLAKDAIAYASTANMNRIRLPFAHLWRSFSRGFLHDPAYPERVICPKIASGTTTMQTDKRVWHFGYAQSAAIIEYKLLTHGHRAEFRKDCDWFTDVFMANRQTDCHPVGSGYWNCNDIDAAQLPSVLHDHPYFHLKVIP